MRFKEGETPRTRVRNLVLPFHYEDETVAISDTFTRQIREALENLRDKHGLTVRFIGYTDDAPLTGRDESIYGNQLALSKAMANRVALEMQRVLGLPASAIESDGRGASRPVASNETAQGRALNRRVEGAGTRVESSRRGGILVRRSSPGVVGRAAVVPG